MEALTFEACRSFSCKICFHIVLRSNFTQQNTVLNCGLEKKTKFKTPHSIVMTLIWATFVYVSFLYYIYSDWRTKLKPPLSLTAFHPWSDWASRLLFLSASSLQRSVFTVDVTSLTIQAAMTLQSFPFLKPGMQASQQRQRKAKRNNAAPCLFQTCPIGIQNPLAFFLYRPIYKSAFTDIN